jgi:transposase
MPRTLQGALIAMKQTVFDQCRNKEITGLAGAKLLHMHPKSFSRLKARYEREGVPALSPRRPGPRPGKPPANRTDDRLEEMVVRLANQHPQLGPISLCDQLFDQSGIRLNQSTIWRILKRKKVRYTTQYNRWKSDPKLYCLEKPGIELQMDACYPFGRARDCALFDAIDDCSRWVDGKFYRRETAHNAMDFVRYLERRVPFPINRIRVDNRYGKLFKEFCERRGIEVIANDPYTPEQNGKIERFHKTVKREFIWRHCSFQDSNNYLQYKLAQWLHHYNTKRRHGGYGMYRMTPQQKIATTLLTNLSLIYPQKVTGTLQQYTCVLYVTNLLY